MRHGTPLQCRYRRTAAFCHPRPRAQLCLSWGGVPCHDHRMPQYEITTDRSRMDVQAIHAFLSQSYWSPGVPLSVVERAMQNSLCFAILSEGRHVGFARVVTDRATFGYLADVHVLEEHRGRGLSKRLMRAVMEHPDLQGLRRMMLATRDAHGLYEQYGFKPLASPAVMMEVHDPDVYSRPAAGQGGSSAEVPGTGVRR